ncbi:hypothetical protein N7466_000100 [Penicillium verhagenii]|uniref:uncharacterized protein n=1 Tax=Penicillium verhagenii TaxID=1562060 RepID=UPI0025456828|nr:uncharacterized protein N7466_000100 [Penicillium verhagenii]KAJ5947085.1 hypothetical protein N7466_000100 [Penicillium verhagenii]
MAMFSKRLNCFYCGTRSSKSIRDSIDKFHCDSCDADNFLDKNGEITDPPTEITNSKVQGDGASSQGLRSNVHESGVFCSQCLRNQHLFTSSLAGFVPENDDKLDPQFDSNYESYRRELENLYPQVCETCEPRVKQRIREAGYEAKADNLRRMMDQTRAFKNEQRLRRHSWQSLVVYLGALAYWISILGQLAWDALSALTVYPAEENIDISIDAPVSFMSVVPCVRKMIELRGIPQEWSYNLAPTAGLALIAGCLSIWWNPKIRMKIYGRLGRFYGLGEYYQLQLLSLVLRCVFWSLFKDPSASGIDSKGSFVGHIVMAGITIVCVIASRHVVKYDRRTVVDWSDNSWENAPLCSPSSSPPPAQRRSPNPELTPRATNNGIREPFPISRLTSPQSAVTKSSAFPTPPPDGSDDMDWTPSRSHDIRPEVSLYQRDKPSVFDGPTPFYGSIPTVSKPPSWELRTRPSNKPVDQVVQRNPFHRSPTNSPTSWQHKSATTTPVFKDPTFFPTTDHESTGLETLFDRAFTIDPNNTSRRNEEHQPRHRTSPPYRIQGQAMWQVLRFLFLLSSIVAWSLSQNRIFLIHGNYIETIALGSASLIAGLGFLEAVKRPIAEWSGLELLVNVTELIVAVHLGAHMPKTFRDRELFDRYGKLLLIFMAVQEVMGLLAFYRTQATPAKSAEETQPSPASPFGSPQYERPQLEAPVYSPTSSTTAHSPTLYSAHNPFRSPPPLSFGTTAGSASFSSALPYSSLSSQGLRSANPVHSHNPHSFTMQSLKENEPSDYEQDSDGETVATSATGWTNTTNQNIRYGHRPGTAQSNDIFFSPRRNQLTPGLGGLSLEDGPNSRRMTRSQTQQSLNARGISSRATPTRW